jgi:hypothetical protein
MQIGIGLGLTRGGGGGGAPLEAPLLVWDNTNYPDAPALSTTVVNNNAVNTLTDFPGMSGVRAVRMKPSGGGTYIMRIGSSGTVDLSDIDQLYVPICPGDNNTTNGTAIVTFFVASSASPLSNRKTFTQYIRSKAPGVPFIACLDLKQAANTTTGSMTDGWATQTGTVDWSAVNTFGVQVAAVTAGNNTDTNVFYVGDVFASAARPKGQLMIGFDGPYATAVANAVPILDAAGIKATFYVEKYLLGTGDLASLSQVRDLSAAGHVIALHSYSKLLNTTNATDFPDAASIAAEITDFNAWAASEGLNTAPKHACIAISNPFDSSDYARELIARDGYLAGGLASWREGTDTYAPRKLNHRLRRLTPAPIQTLPLTSTTNIADIESLMQKAADLSALISIYTHSVDETALSGGHASIAMIQAVADKYEALRDLGVMQNITPDRLAA